MTQNFTQVKDGLSNSSGKNIRKLIIDMAKLADISKKTKINHEQLLHSLNKDFAGSAWLLTVGLHSSTKQSFKLRKEVSVIGQELKGAVKYADALTNSLQEGRSLPESSYLAVSSPTAKKKTSFSKDSTLNKSHGKKGGEKYQAENRLDLYVNSAKELFKVLTKSKKQGKGGKGDTFGLIAGAAKDLFAVLGKGGKQGKGGKGDTFGLIAGAAKELFSVLGKGGKQGKGGKGDTFGLIAGAAKELFSALGKGGKQGKGGKGDTFGLIAGAAKELFSALGKGGKQGKGGKGDTFGLIAGAAKELFSVLGKGGKQGKGGKGDTFALIAGAAKDLFALLGKGGKQGKGGKGDTFGLIAGAAKDLFANFLGSKSGAPGQKGGAVDMGFKALLPLLKKAGLKTALNPFKQVELVKMAAVGGWKVGSFINSKIETVQKANEISAAKAENKSFNAHSGDMFAAKKSGNRSAQYRAVANMWLDQGNTEKANEYFAKSRDAAKVQNQVNLNIKIDEKGRITTETADMDTKSKITVDRGMA